MSLRVRLLVAVGAVALLALVAADLATYSVLKTSLYGQDSRSLSSAQSTLQAKLDNGEALSLATVARDAPGMFVELRAPNGAVLAAIDAYQRGGQPLIPALPSDIEALQPPLEGSPFQGSTASSAYFTVGSAQPGGPPFRVAVAVLLGGDQLILALPLSQTLATLHRLVITELAVTALAVLAAIILGWWLVRLGLRPLKDIEQTAMGIADGQLDLRVPPASPGTEVGKLASAFNTMLARIQDAFSQRDATETELRSSKERLRRFVADASHELRTPLSAVAAYAELFERGASSRPEDLERVMSGIRSETARMAGLVEDLLLLARLDEKRPLNCASVELVDVALEAIQAARTVGPQWPLTLKASESVEVLGDAGRLRQVVDNLLGNVRVHTPAGTAAEVLIASDGNQAILSVTDHGPGLHGENIEQVFQRFYRADPSRSRGDGGAGLGLSIVQAIVEAHGGQVRASQTPGGGATFTVTLPLNDRSSQEGRCRNAEQL